MKGVLKKINAWLHLWLGLVSGIIVLIVSLTGCILVFEQEIKALFPWVRAERNEGDIYLPPSALYQSVRQAFPGTDIHSVWYHGHGRSAHMSLDGDSMVYVNPYSGAVQALVDHEDFFHFIEEGHRHLWLPLEAGRAIVGWGTLIFFILLITGVVLWWPKRWNKRGLQQSFTVRWKARFKRLNYDLHNVLGFYSLIVAVIMAFTGLMMSFSWFSKSVYWMAGGTLQQYIRPVSDTAQIGKTLMMEQVDKAWAKGMNEIGQHNKDAIIVHFPDEPAEAIYVCVDMYRGSWRDLYLDQYTLEELPASRPRLSDTDKANWLRRMNYGLHVGEVGGVTTKIIYFLASLICASLPVTGFIVWWGKKKKKINVVQKKAPLRDPSI